MLRALAGWTCVCGVLAVARGGDAQEQDGPAPVNSTASVSAGADADITSATRTAMARTAEAPGHPPGSYAGVVPGSSSAPPVFVAKTETRPLITWPGFQMRTDGTSRVFIQSTSALTPQPSAAAAKFSVYLPGAKVAGNTNRLPLETRFFNTPVSRVNLEVQRDGVTLVLDLRGDVSPVVSSERGPTGYYFLYIDLPKGQYVKSAPAAAEAPPAPPSTTERTKHLEASKPVSASGEVQVHTAGRGNVEAGSGEAKASTRVRAKAGIKLGP